MIRVSRYLFSKRANHAEIAIIGGGTGGINTAAQLIRDGHFNPNEIAIIDPSRIHAYQPGWTMVGGGLYDVNKTLKPLEDVLPLGVHQYHETVIEIDAPNNLIKTASGNLITYDQLIIASGIQLDFTQIKGAQEFLDDANYPVSTIYTAQYASKMNKLVDNFKGGRIIFTEPQMPIKCGGAPQKIMYLTHDRLKKKGVNAKIEMHMAKASVFGVPKYAEILSNLIQQKGIHLQLKNKLIEVQDHKAIFENQETKEITVKEFDLLHLVPPMKAPSFIAKSGLGDAAGYVNVHPGTLQHVKYQNIWGLGDSSNLPTSKTAAAVMAQTPVLVNNLVRALQLHDKPIPDYKGYTSCPIFTSQSELLLAEFKYDSQLDETFPFLQNKPNRLMYWMKTKFFPLAYWQFMIRGYWAGRDGLRVFMD